MKITIDRNQAFTKRAFRAAVLPKVERQIIYAGQAQMNYLAGVLDLVANAEADKIYSVLSDVIDNPTWNFGLQALDLERGISAVPEVSGRIKWKDLSDSYLTQKAKVDTRYTYSFNRAAGFQPKQIGKKDDGSARFAEQNFFRYLGPLSAYFRNQGTSIVQGRMGGVKVTIDASGLQAGSRSTVSDYAYGEAIDKLLIGRLDIEVFPDVTASLLPGLASNRWTKTLENGQFEEDIFDGTKTGYKLAQNHHDSVFYRALVAPAVQFWILVRIPTVIRQRLQLYLSRASVKKVKDL